MARAHIRGRVGRGAAVAALLIASGACSQGGGDPPAPGASGPATTSPSTPGPEVTSVDWRDVPPAVPLGDGWEAGRCEGDAPLICIRRGGELVGVVELAGFPAASFTMPGFQDAVGRGDVVAALRLAAQDSDASVRQDRPVGCGAGYGVTTIPPQQRTVSGGPGLLWGFTGTAGGAVVEHQRTYGAIRDGTLWIQSAAGYAPGSCMAPEARTFTPAELDAFAPLLDALVAATVLPDEIPGRGA